MAKGRGRLNSIQLLPEACGPTVTWALAEMNRTDRTLTDIYAEFVTKLEAVEREYRGEVEFKIPSFSSFHRHSFNIAVATKRMADVREIAGSLFEQYDPEESDQLTIIATEAIKTLVFEIYMSRGDKVEAKDANYMASALRAAAQAQNVSSDRRRKVEAEFAAKAKEAVKTVQKAKGLSDEAASDILDKLLGVTK